VYTAWGPRSPLSSDALSSSVALASRAGLLFSSPSRAPSSRAGLSSCPVWALSLGLLCSVELGCSGSPQSLLITPPPTGNAGTHATGAGGSAGDKAQSGGSDAGLNAAGGNDQGRPDASTHPDPPDPNPDPNADPFASPPALRDAVPLNDSELANQALAILTNTCGGCHQLGRPTLTEWAQDTKSFATACLADPDLENQAAVDTLMGCVRSHSNVPASPFKPDDFGIYAAAARLPWFSFLFQHAAGTTDPNAAIASFIGQAGMPLSGQPLTQDQFDIVAEWFARNLPNLSDLVPADPGETCTPGLLPELNTYLDSMATAGWRAKNAEVPLLMYGCASGQSGSQCLSSLPRAADQSFGTGWELSGTQIRILHDNSASHSTYWSRSSADGRFIGSGLRDATDSNVAGQFVDLQSNQTLLGDFAYDATFFPDNSGFLVQRGGYDDGSDNGPSDGTAKSAAEAVVCPQSVIESDPPEVHGTEPGCTLIDATFGLYQQPGKAVDGGDYWVVFGSYQSDNGGFGPTLEDPQAAFDTQSSVTLVPMVNQGNGFVAGSGSKTVTPHQGDPVLSPSGGLLVTRTKGAERNDGNVVHADQSGYALYRVSTSGSGVNESATLHDVGRVCLQGSKATLSYDERWMVFHHYVVEADATALGFASANDPGFADYLQSGASNLYLVDLRTGTSKRITNMKPGQYALFPHFRSDGWIYFVVRTLGDSEYFAASDAALVSETP
jgi:hypothetical protein